MAGKNNIKVESFPEILFDLEDKDFDALALRVFHYQFHNNIIYRQWCEYIGKTPDKVVYVTDIPLLPIQFFKSHQIKTGQWTNGIVFSSSGTTGVKTSSHEVPSIEYYNKISLEIFRQFYGNPEDYVFLALLPSYLEREGSSLIAMVEMLIRKSTNSLSGFFLNDYDNLIKRYREAVEMGKKIMIWGVSFALLDLAEKGELSLKEAIIIETGGMKGRRKELTRAELHETLKSGLKVGEIHSEYGMTELTSQAYSSQNGLFMTPNWLKVVTIEVNDPFSLCSPKEAGIIGLIDLGNVHSCSFLATQDLGKRYDNATFEVTGRLDNSDIRGCNLMII